MNEQEERAKEVIKAVLLKVFFAFIPAFIGIAMIVHENIYGCSGSVGCLGGIIFYLGVDGSGWFDISYSGNMGNSRRHSTK